MATTFSVTTSLSLVWKFKNTTGLSDVKDYTTYEVSEALTNGTANNLANDMYRNRLYLTPAAATIDLDLSGTLTNVFGEVLAFSKIRQIVVVNKGVPDVAHEVWTPTAGEYVIVGGAGTGDTWATMFNASTAAAIKLPSGGMFACTAPLDGWAVASGTGDKLRIALSGGGVASVDVDIILIGTD